MPARSNSHQLIGHFSNPYPHHLMALLFVGAKFKHIAQYSHLSAFQLGQEVNGSQHGLWRSVISIIKQQCPALGANYR